MWRDYNNIIDPLLFKFVVFIILVLSLFLSMLSGMKEVRGSIDKKRRRFNASVENQRQQQELALRPSGATLIIVPIVLLEHW